MSSRRRLSAVYLALVTMLVSGAVLVPQAEAHNKGKHCTKGYKPCLHPASDYDCYGGGGNGPKYVYQSVKVTGSDPYKLDANDDGIGCDNL
jgi:hypothetical protein